MNNFLSKSSYFHSIESWSIYSIHSKKKRCRYFFLLSFTNVFHTIKRICTKSAILRHFCKSDVSSTIFIIYVIKNVWILANQHIWAASCVCTDACMPMFHCLFLFLLIKKKIFLILDKKKFLLSKKVWQLITWTK